MQVLHNIWIDQLIFTKNQPWMVITVSLITIRVHSFETNLAKLTRMVKIDVESLPNTFVLKFISKCL